MKNQRNIFILRFVNALVFIFTIYVQYNSSFNLKIFNANPMLPLAFLVSVCIFCSELRGAIIGLVVGIFIDTTASTPHGFNAIVFMCLGLASTLVIKHLFNNNIFSAVTLCALCSFIYFSLRWFICIAFYASFAENISYLFNTAFTSCIYTAIFTIPFYYLEKYLYNKFYK